MDKNFGVCCDVKACKHNSDGLACNLKKIRVTCGCGEDCTCCQSFEEK